MRSASGIRKYCDGNGELSTRKNVTPILRFMMQPWACGAFLAVAACIFMPGSLRASCGDYLHILPQDGSAATDASPVPDGHPSNHGKLPCRGPNCSKNSVPMAPVVPVPPGGSQPVPTDVLFALHCVENQDNDSRPMTSELLLVPQTSLLSIFHPPRV